MKFVKGWYLPDSDTHFEHYIKDGSYQTIHRETILRYIKMKKPELKNCIDIGSHIGFWSKDFTNTFKHTYAFDPIPQVRECYVTVSYTHLRAHETREDLVWRVVR